MTCIHGNKVNKWTEFNLQHDILNPPKLTKNLNSHYYPILQGCINTKRCKAKFKNFWILLNSGCSSTVRMGRLIQKLHPKVGTVMQWHTQAGKSNTNINVQIYFTPPELSANNVTICNYYMDDSTKGRYDMILGRNILTALWLNT